MHTLNTFFQKIGRPPGGKYDLVFLGFIVTFPVNMIAVKPLLLAAFLFYVRKDLSRQSFKAIPKFYWLLPLLEIPKWLFLQTDHSAPSAMVAGIGMLYWWMCAGAFLFVFSRTRKNAPGVSGSLSIYFLMNAVVSVGQLIVVCFKAHSANPYALESPVYGGSTGDFIKGLMLGPSYLNMMVNTAFAIYYLAAGRRLHAIIAVVVICLTATNFGNIIFIPLLTIFAFALWKKAALITLALQLGIFALYYTALSPGNASHLKNSLEVSTPQPGAPENGKVLAVKETIKFVRGGARQLMTGAGVGRFSSSVALNTSGLTENGTGSRLFRELPRYVAPEYRQNHYAIYKMVFDAPTTFHSIRQMPASFFNQIFGEYGLLGALLFLFFYLGYFLKRWRSLSYGRILLPLLCAFLLFDYLFDYLSVVIFFEVFLLLNLSAKAHLSPA